MDILSNLTLASILSFKLEKRIYNFQTIAFDLNNLLSDDLRLATVLFLILSRLSSLRGSQVITSYKQNLIQFTLSIHYLILC